MCLFAVSCLAWSTSLFVQIQVRAVRNKIRKLLQKCLSAPDKEGGVCFFTRTGDLCLLLLELDAETLGSLVKL